jgi:uncharacterized protein
MQEFRIIPVFPLTLLPFPGELVPLHIFEPRYRQLLQDAETTDIEFGIYCNHDLNKVRLGSLMKLESIIKRYPTGESDIVVRCTDVFSMQKMLRNFKSKLYPGAEVQMWAVKTDEMPGIHLYENFIEYQRRRKINTHVNLFNVYQMAIELNLDLFDRYKFLNSSYERKLLFLSTQLKFQLHVLHQEEKSKDLFHLN